MNKNFVLLKTLLLSTSQWNVYKNCRDGKKRGRIIGNSIGLLVLYLMLMAYCIANCIGYGMMGLVESIPVLCALVISALAFFFTMFKTNGYLFAFKEYDMLMSLPFRPKDIAAGKFLYMYVQSLPWYMSVSLAMMIVYGVYSGAAAAVYPLWVILSLILPVIPMLAAAFAGFLIAKAGSGFQNKTMAQTVLVLIFVLICFASRFFLEDAIRGGRMNEVLETISDSTERVSGIYLPAGWFAGAVSRFEISGMLLLAGSSIALFELIFLFVGNSYRKINSALKSHAASGNFVMAEQKGRSLLHTIAFKEFRRMTGSVTYMPNALIGECLCLISGIAVLFVDFDRMLAKILQDAPVTKEMLYPAIPLIIYFFIGIVATTAFTLSLEGKNYWIVQSLPISRKVLCQGKMLFNLYLTLPVTLFATVTFCISSGAPFLNTVLYLILGICLCAFSTAWGMVCGIKHMRLDWENEVEIIKQGAAVAVYLMPNMLGSMILIVGVVALGTVISQNLITLCLILLVLGLAVLSYRKVLSLCRE
ncbi:MAG: hypothetical protein J6Z35_11025 [Lachnospiraceae bacterium]|nr:hypothetical protein [Lachnospiraceae bacterium]